MAELNPEQWAEVKRLFMGAVELRPEELPGLPAARMPGPGSAAGSGVPAGLFRQAACLGRRGDCIGGRGAAQEPDPDERLIGTRLGPYEWRPSPATAAWARSTAPRATMPSFTSRWPSNWCAWRPSRPHLAALPAGAPDPGPPVAPQHRPAAGWRLHARGRALPGDGIHRGRPITAWCERHTLGVEERLRLFLRVCEGVEFAHRDLVVHRDLKPANILVTKDGTPKLLDFGIAKLLDPARRTEPQPDRPGDDARIRLTGAGARRAGFHRGGCLLAGPHSL
jgi:hypothetical protein